MVEKSAKVYRKIFIESILYPIYYDQKKLDIWRIPFLVVRICESIVAAMIKELFSQPQVSQNRTYLCSQFMGILIRYLIYRVRPSKSN